MSRVVHFELFAPEPGALADFYRNVFGWEISAWEGPFEYQLVSTGPAGDMGIDGAIAPFGDAGDQRTVVTIGVGDIGATAEKVFAAGGSAVTEKNAVPGIGWQRYFRDPSGLVFGVLQPDRTAGIPIGMVRTPEEQSRDAWADVGDRLREFGTTIGTVVNEAAASPQAQRAREQAEKAATAIGEASRQAADRALPHVVTALDRVSMELGELAARLRRERDQQAEPPAGGEPGGGPGGEGPAAPPEA
jgi:predicted enzyme related to lactoylglutathione lyase